MIRSCLLASNNTSLLTIGDDNKIILWDKKEKQAVFDLHKGKVSSAEFSPDNRFALSAAGENDNTVKLWDAQGDLILTINFDQEPLAHFSPDGKKILASSTDGTTRICPIPQMILNQIRHGEIKAPTISAGTLAKYSLE